MPTLFVRRPALALVAALAASSLALVACGSSSSGKGGTTTNPGSSGSPSASAAASSGGGGGGSSLAAGVPDAIKKDGTITVGTDATYAPSEFLGTDGKTVMGFDIDLFNAVAGKLGLKAKYVPAPFDSIIPGVISARKYEVGVSSFTINPQRKQQADMISYYSAGTAWATPKGNPDGISIDSACGKKIAVQRGTVQVDDITARDKACKTAGKPGISIDQYQGQDQATSSVVSGKDQAMLADYPVIVYAVQQTGGKLEQLGQQYGAAPYGYVIAKGQQGFADALLAGIKAIMADGTYKKILDKWNVAQGAITNPQLNP